MYNRTMRKTKALKCLHYEDLILMIEEILEEIFKHTLSINAAHDDFSQSVLHHQLEKFCIWMLLETSILE